MLEQIRHIAHYLLRRSNFLFADELYLKWMFYLFMGEKLDLQHPKTFSEKMQWLKLHNRKPEYALMVDKVAVKEYVAPIIGKEHVIPTLGIWDDVDDIDFSTLPNQFVLKTSQGGGNMGVVICRDKSTFDKNTVSKRLKKALKQDIYATYREWPYKNVQRRILAEQLMTDQSHRGDLRDYKFFCFNGSPLLCQVISDRNSDEKIDFYDMAWNRLIGLIGLNVHAHNSATGIACPVSFEEMKTMATKLSANIPFVRIDFYEINHEAYFGEITFFPNSGFGEFQPTEWNERLGEMIPIHNNT